MYFYINNIPIYFFSEYKFFTIIQFCDFVRLSIPRFCYHHKLTIAGNCRMCMVELGNAIKPMIACATSLAFNIEIFTDSLFVKKARENVLEFLLINHPLDCPICDQAGECDLQDQSILYGSDRGRYKEMKRSVEDKELGPIVKSIMTRCIHCTRCIRYSDEVAGVKDLGMIGRGNDSEVKMTNLFFYDSEISGNVADICPVGALTIKPYAFTARPWELKSVETIDVLDSLHSNLKIDLKGNRILRILPKQNESVNEDFISDFVRFSYQSVQLVRFQYPFLLTNKLNNFTNLREIQSWEQCSEFLKYLVDTYKINVFKFLVGNQIGIFNSSLFYYYSKFFKNSSFFLENNSYNNIDLRNSFYVNEFNSFIQSNLFINFNLNLKNNFSVFNARFTRFLNTTYHKKYIIYIGLNVEHTYNYLHLGCSFSSLYKLLRGKFLSNFLFFNLIKKNLNFFSYFNSSLFSTYLKNLNIFDDYQLNNMSFFSNINTFSELGYTSSLTDYSNMNKSNNYFSLYYFYKTEKTLVKEMNNVFSIYHGANPPYINKKNNFLFLPSNSLYEQEDSYINIFGDLQNTHQVIDLTHKQEIKSDFYILKNILFSILYMNIINHKINEFYYFDLLFNELIFTYFNYFCILFDFFPSVIHYNLNSYNFFSNVFKYTYSIKNNMQIRKLFTTTYSTTLQEFYYLKDNKKKNSFF